MREVGEYLWSNVLSGLVKGISVKEPVRGGLRKAGAVRVEKKLKRTAKSP